MPGLLDPVLEALRGAGYEPPQAAIHDLWFKPLDRVADEHGFPREAREAAWRAYEKLEITSPLAGYGDATAIRDLPGLRFLVTAGFRRLQESKIRALGIAPLFTAIYVDAIDEPGRRGKARIFEEILARYGLRPAEVTVVGDSPDSEIAAGRSLGMATVQILRRGVAPGGGADRTVRSLAELRTG